MESDKSGIPQVRKSETESRQGSKKVQLRQEGQTDPETLKFKSLFHSLLTEKKYTRDFIMKFIEEDTGGTGQAIVDEWLAGNIPRPVYQTGIMIALENLDQRPVKNIAPLSKQGKALEDFLSKPPKPIIKAGEKRRMQPLTREQVEAIEENLKKKGNRIK